MTEIVQQLKVRREPTAVLNPPAARPSRSSRPREKILMSALEKTGGRRSPSARRSSPDQQPPSVARDRGKHMMSIDPAQQATTSNLETSHVRDRNGAEDAPLSRTDQAAEQRNHRRRVERDAADNHILSKYLPDDISIVLGEVILGPDDNFQPPHWFIEAIRTVSDEPTPAPKPPPVRFTTNPSDLQANAELLHHHNHDLGALLKAATGTTLDPAAEFRPVTQLDKLFANHPNYPFVRDMISNGMDYKVTRKLTEGERIAELDANLTRGNHKSATANQEHLIRLLDRDVQFGFAMPVPVAEVRRIKGAMVQPAGLVDQFTILPDGSRVRKQRLTHDLSYSATLPDASINARIDLDTYPEMVYGYCLMRVVHFVVALRASYPSTRIFISKYDFSDAYRRVAHTAQAAAQTILSLGGVAYVMLRLAFGGSPNPPAWCAFSEMVTDLANEIPLCKEWSPKTISSPVENTHRDPKVLDANLPFCPAAPMAVNVPVSVTAKADCFIDDIIHVMLDSEENMIRQPPAVPLAVHLSNRPHQGGDEPMPRRANISAPKMEAEGTPAETQTVLGWDIQTRQLLIQLPQDKFIAWSVDVAEIIRTKSVQFGALESCVGRLNHASFVIPLARHFISRLRRRIQYTQKKTDRLTLSSDEIEDLMLWLVFLQQARKGLSMNLLTHRSPTVIGISDSCPYGLGGFTWRGSAWRLQIPTSSIIYGDHTANNALEMLAMVVTVWLMIIESNQDHECLLCLGDNTSAIGWFFHSSFLNGDSLYTKVVPMMARKLARLVIEANHTIFAQHIAGTDNTVADMLSYTHQRRDGKQNPLAYDKPSDALLTARFHTHLPQLIPRTFAISPLPNDILSFVTLVLQTMELSMMQRARQPLRAKTEPGEASWTRSGDLSRIHSKPLSATTIQNAAGNLAAAFQVRLRESPLHIQNSTQLLPSLKSLFRAFENMDPPQQRQKAITPRFLRALHLAGSNPSITANAYDHAVDLIIGAFFFAMRSCEYCIPSKQGRTKTLRLRHLRFRDKDRVILPISHPHLDTVAEFVTVTFEDQKSGVKMDSRSQRRTTDKHLCPCRRLGRAVMRVTQTVPNWSNDTLLCAVQLNSKTLFITNTFTRKLIRHTCQLHGGHHRFGFHPHELGNRSIRSGAAMALFIKDHSTAKIMILGRWSSDAFLVYIRPQVLEWANNMSKDMIDFDSFLDVGFFDRITPADSRTRRRSHTLTGTGVTIPVNAFNLHH